MRETNFQDAQIAFNEEAIQSIELLTSIVTTQVEVQDGIVGVQDRTIEVLRHLTRLLGIIIFVVLMLEIAIGLLIIGVL